MTIPFRSPTQSNSIGLEWAYSSVMAKGHAVRAQRT
jgi:hypothetical protein